MHTPKQKTPVAHNTGFLPEKEGHRIYYAEYGNTAGSPVVALHGGPGSHSKASHTLRFDTERHRVITFDQRGRGSSEPAGELEHNTTQHLIADMERLREYLGVKRWFVSGSSWGAALALAYAQTHPGRVRGLLLSSVFLARKRDIAWAFTDENGAARMFPDVWREREQFLREYDATPENAAETLLKEMEQGSEETQKAIAAGVSNWEHNLFSLAKEVRYKSAEEVDEGDITAARIFLHYEANGFFLADNQLVDNLEAIRDIPSVIVHGRHDVLTPFEQAQVLYDGLDNAELVVLHASPHLLSADGKTARTLAFTSALDRWTKDTA